MKNILLIVFTFLSFSLFAQSSEFMVSYQSSLKNDNYGKGMALSYYKYVSNKTALAFKSNLNFNSNGDNYFPIKSNSLSFDLVNRITFIEKSNFRLMGELGLSVLRNYTELIDNPNVHEEINRINTGVIFCGVLDYYPFDAKFVQDHPGQKWFKSNHYGLASAINIDYTIKDVFIIGIGYGLNLYRTTNEKITNKKSQRSNLNVSLGVKF